MATYVISDIHGYLSRMFDVLDQAKFDWDKDELYILGDIIDRGPESADALQWIMEEAPRNVHMLCGNHEDMAYSGLMKIRDEGYVVNYIYNNPWSWNGGITTLDQLREARGSQWCHKAALWIRNLPMYFTVNVNGMDILMVHAGLADGLKMSDDFIETGIQEWIDIPKVGKVWSQHLLWVRERWLYNRINYPYDYIIFGHTPTSINWMQNLNWFNEEYPIGIQGRPGYMVRLSGYGHGHMRYCIDTGRERLGLLRLDDMMEFYSTLEIEDEDD